MNEGMNVPPPQHGHAARGGAARRRHVAHIVMMFGASTVVAVVVVVAHAALGESRTLGAGGGEPGLVCLGWRAHARGACTTP
eukprot:scaffold6569_cov300-Prasinococcus_capsulatus_cf.AAC.2